MPRGIGHGASTGQTSGIHPDDFMTLYTHMQTLAALGPNDPVPVMTGVRFRWSGVGGGWRSGEGRAYRLSPKHHPTVWVLIGVIHPLDSSADSDTPQALSD